MKFRIIILFLVLSLSLTGFSQRQKKIDSLLQVTHNKPEKELANTYFELTDLYLRISNDTALIYAKNALKISNEQKQDTIKIKVLNKIANIHIRNNPDTAYYFANSAFQLADSIGYLKGKAAAIYIYGFYNYIKGDLKKTLENNKSLVEIYKELEDDQQLAITYNSLGMVNKNLGKYDEAVNYYIEASKIQEARKDSIPLARILSNLGNVFFYYGKDYVKAEKNYTKALIIFRELKQKREVGTILNNLAMLFMHEEAKKDFKKAKKYLDEAEKIFKERNDNYGLATTYQHKGRLYSYQKKFSRALMMLNKSYRLNKEIKNKKEIAFTLETMAEVYFEWGKYQEALRKYQEAIKIAQSSNLDKMALEMYKDVSKCYEKLGDMPAALEYYRRYSDIKDSAFSNESLKQIRELETKYETEKKESELKMKEQQLQMKDLKIQKTEAEQQRQKTITYVTLSGLLVFLGFSVIVFKQYREKRAANQSLFKQNIRIKQANEEINQANEEITAQNEEIQRQKEFVEQQHDEIKDKNKQITDSIQYAKRIQSALLPPEEVISTRIKDYFILYKPKDIVSGDFYWATQEDDDVIIAAADCTGHGVPGAFMSMLGVSFLNEIVRSEKGLSTADILERLRANVIASLRQTGKAGETKDGMDMAMVRINTKTLKAEFTGAYNPLYIIRNNELEQIKADKMPIGFYFKADKWFTNNVLTLQKGDRLYMFSDGFVDQFGGPKNQKFMTKRFKALLTEIHLQPMQAQRVRLDKELEDWRGDQSQLDDILVIGLRI